MAPFNADLVDDLARQKVVLFLGAGVSASATTRSGNSIRDWKSFLLYLCGEVSEDVSVQVQGLIEKNDYLVACEILKLSIGERWAELVNNEFSQIAEPSDLHKSIIKLRQRIILTTNFDKIIENFWNNSSDMSTHFPTIIDNIEQDIFKIFKDHRGKYLIKVHGTIDKKDSMIFSRSDYIRMAFGNGMYSTFLETLLLNYTFLFIGFSMEDPAILSLVEMYALRYPNARPHYIFGSHTTPTNILELNKTLRKLQFIQYDDKDNHSQLPRLIDKLANSAEERRRELFADEIGSRVI